MNYTKEQVINYLIDCVGYSVEDLKGLTKSYLMGLVERPSELRFYSN